MICVNNLTKKYFGRFVLNDVTYHFPESGIVALIGNNGAGKSTLLKLLTEEIVPDSGAVSKPKSVHLAYMPQVPNPNPESSILDEAMAGRRELYDAANERQQLIRELKVEYSDQKFSRLEVLESYFSNHGGYTFEADTCKLLEGLGFKEDHYFDDPQTLSGGWRMRLELVRLFIKQADFLILDEPNNHLDLPAINWLEEHLLAFKGLVLFVSHDRSLLTRLPDTILHLKGGNLVEYHGNYDDFLEQYELKALGREAEIKNLERRIEKTAKCAERLKGITAKARQSRGRVKIISRMQDEAAAINIDRGDGEIDIQIPNTQKSSKDVIKLENCAIGYDKPLMGNISLLVSRGQKMAIVGANGLGKSTLMKSVMGRMPFLAGSCLLGQNIRIAYYAQDHAESLDLEVTALENLKEANGGLPEPVARKILGSFLFKGQDVLKPANVLSGGEKSRLSLACLLVKDANLLFLDEPTNHLDLLSTEILGEALSDYAGTVMFISHNRSFINQVATHVLAFASDGHVRLVHGNLDDVDPKWIM